MVLRTRGIDYQSLDQAGRDYVVKRLEAAFRTLNDRARIYQVLFKHNRPQITLQNYDNALVQATVEQRRAFLEEKADRLYEVEIFWIVMIDGNYARTGLLHALSQLPKAPAEAFKQMKALLAGDQQ